MAVDMFIKIDDIKGESVDDKHKDEIDVLAWSWGLTQSGTAHSGSGGGAGKVHVNDLSITKYVDRSSPILIKSCCSGKHLKTALLVVRKAGGDKPLEYLKITMEDVLVSAVTTGGSGGEDRLTENVTLNFARVKLEYTPQKSASAGGGGGADASIPMGWDIAANKEI
jgi:type VI secretion system secreted protein Hcp